MNSLMLILKAFLILGIVSVNCSPLILSDYIRENRLTEAKTLSEVKGLPNAPKIKSYSGFFTVDLKYNSNIFFWFFPSFKNPSRAPIVIWLEGGPGSSSLWSLFEMHGPFRVDQNLKVSLNEYSWTQEFSMIYIDNPVGTGFSFTDDEKGYSTDQNSVANNLYNFLKQFYQIFSEYRDNELYIAGESYAGKYVPSLGYKLLQVANESNINFKGVAIGNGMTDPINQLDDFQYLKSTGLIDEKEQDDLKTLENQFREYYKNKEFPKASESYRNLSLISGESNEAGYLNLYNSLRSTYTSENDDTDYFETYLQLNETRKALHVSNVKYWVGNVTVNQKLSNDMIRSVMENMTALIPHYKVMLFVGNLDTLVGPSQVNAMLENKEWKYYKEFYHAQRVIWKVDKNDTEVAGYAKGFGNFLQVIVRNAGHSVSLTQPRSNLDLMRRFIYNLSFERNNF